MSAGFATTLSAYQTNRFRHVRDLQLATAAPMGECLQGVVAGLGALGVAFYFSWNLTLVIIATMPIIYFVMSFLSSRLSKRAQEQADRLQEALKYVTNAIRSIEMVKCFNGESSELQKYGNAVSHAARLYNRQAAFRSFQIGFMQFITMSVFVQGFWYGSYLVSSEQRNAGQVVTTFWAALIAVQMITGFIPQLIVLQKGRVAAVRLLAIVSRISKHDKGLETQNGEKPDCFSGDIEFEKVIYHPLPWFSVVDS